MEDHYRVFAWAGLVCAAVSAFFLIRNGAASTTAINLAVPPAAAAIAVLASHKRPVCFAAGALFLVFSFVFGVRLNSPDIDFQMLFPSVYSMFIGSWLDVALIVYALKQRLPYVGWFTLIITVGGLTDLYISWLTGRIAPDVASRFFPIYWPVFLAEAADVLLAFAVQFLPQTAPKSGFRKP